MSRLSLIAASVALAGLVPVSRAVAQEPVQEPVTGTYDLRLDHGPDRLMRFVLNRRARLGLKVNLRARSSDSVGAYVDAVTPNGPAAKAGLESGDIITRVDGKSVLSGGQADPERQQQSQPGLHLIELAARLQPNDTIPVEFRRGKDRKTVTLVTADEPDILFRAGPDGRGLGFRYIGPEGPQPMTMPLEGGFDNEVRGPAFLYGPALADLELAPLNAELGRYFGATEGILVIRVPKDSELGLKGGDVVLSVDGRKPASPSHLLRILGSYDRGEGFKLDVLRNHKRETVTGKLGDRQPD